jgi:hypothetical protein
MEKNLIWLSTSLFCKKEIWHQLLNKGIHPFIKQQESDNLIDFLIEINYLSGENIRMALLVEEANAECVARLTDEYFKSFFLKNDFPVKELQLPLEGVFLPFQLNSIQYGLYEPRKVKQSAYANDQVASQLSSIIIAALKDDLIDEETLITLAFYLNTALIKTVSKHTNTSMQLLLPYYSSAGALYSIYDDVIIGKFEENREMLQEIVSDIFSIDHNIPDWLKNWIKQCEDLFKNNPGQQPTIIFSRIIYLINKHLGITENMAALLYYFIRNIYHAFSIVDEKFNPLDEPE